MQPGECTMWLGRWMWGAMLCRSSVCSDTWGWWSSLCTACTTPAGRAGASETESGLRGREPVGGPWGVRVAEAEGSRAARAEAVWKEDSEGPMREFGV